MSGREYAEKTEAAAPRKITVRGKPWSGLRRKATEIAQHLRREARLEAAERKLGIR